MDKVANFQEDLMKMRGMEENKSADGTFSDSSGYNLGSKDSDEVTEHNAIE